VAAGDVSHDIDHMARCSTCDMSAPPNPFADINPYAAPQAGDPRDRLGVGVWRSGENVVMHVAAELPHVCVVTGERAVGAREWQVTWKSPGDILSRRTNIYLPLRRDLLNRYAGARGWSRIGLGLMGAMILVLMTTPWIAETDWVMVTAVAVAMLLGGTGVLTWAIALATIDDPLKVVQSKGDYLWLAGAHPRLLATLPETPIE
jgi:hypothetical protein